MARPKKSAVATEMRKDPSFTEEKWLGEEIKWTPADATMDELAFDKKLRRALNYYNYFYSVKDIRNSLHNWAKQSKSFNDSECKLLAKASDNSLTMTACSLARAVIKGMPQKERVISYLVKVVTNAINGKQELKIVTKTDENAEVIKVVEPTIQDRMAEKTSETIGELEGIIDDFIQGKKVTVKIFDWLKERAVPQNQIGKIQDHFKKQFDEYNEVLEGKDKQLVEGYSNFSKPELNKVIKFLEMMSADFEAYVTHKKAIKKARVKKAPSKEKLVSKVKYMKEHKELRVVSLNPQQIIGAKVVWCYQTKYRKLQRYEVDDHAGTLGIKGTTIIGFNESASSSKTLRKPAEQIAELLKVGKVALRTYMKSIKAVETRATGRLSEDVLILKVE